MTSEQKLIQALQNYERALESLKETKFYTMNEYNQMAIDISFHSASKGAKKVLKDYEKLNNKTKLTYKGRGTWVRESSEKIKPKK